MLQIAPDPLSDALAVLGLTANEVCAYRSALRLGPRPASTIAKVAGLNRGHAYQVLCALKQRGLISEMYRGRLKLFVPTPAEQILSRLDSLSKDLESKKRKLETCLPSLMTGSAKSAVCAEIQTFEGKDGLEKAWEEISNTNLKTDIFAFIDVHQSLLYGSHRDEKLRRRLLQRWKKLGIALSVVSSTSKDNSPQKSGFPSISFGKDIVIFGGCVAFLAQFPRARAILIRSEDFADGMRAVHQFIVGASLS